MLGKGFGLERADEGKILDPDSWVGSAEPVFKGPVVRGKALCVPTSKGWNLIVCPPFPLCSPLYLVPLVLSEYGGEL